MNKEVKPIDEQAFELSDEWKAEIEKRCAELDQRITQSIPAEQVLAKLRACYE